MKKCVCDCVIDFTEKVVILADIYLCKWAATIVGEYHPFFLLAITVIVVS